MTVKAALFEDKRGDGRFFSRWPRSASNRAS